MKLLFWRRREIGKDLKAVTEVAGDQLSPGVGTFAIVLGGIVVTGLAAYVYHRQKQKSRPVKDGSSEKS